MDRLYRSIFPSRMHLVETLVIPPVPRWPRSLACPCVCRRGFSGFLFFRLIFFSRGGPLLNSSEAVSRQERTSPLIRGAVFDCFSFFRTSSPQEVPPLVVQLLLTPAVRFVVCPFSPPPVVFVSLGGTGCLSPVSRSRFLPFLKSGSAVPMSP